MQQKIAPQAVEEDEISFVDYLELMLRRKRLIVTVTLAGFLISVILAFVLPKSYQATARILPPQQDQGIMAMMMSGAGGGLAGLAGNLLGSGTPADQYASILQSERIKGAIIDRFKLMEQYGEKFRIEMYQKLDKQVEITAGKKDGIISISVEDEEPKKAADIANAYIDELGKLVAELSMTSAGSNRAFLEVRLAGSRADLARAEEAMKLFQFKNKVVSVPEQAKASIEGVAQLKAQIALQEAQLSGLRSQFTDSTPEVQAARASIGNLKSQLAGLEGMGTGAIPSFGSVPGLGQEQIRLLREFKTQEMIVELLTKQHELAKLTEAKNVSSIQVIQRAEAPDKKYKPKRRNLVLGVTFVSFVFSVSYAVFLSYLAMMPAGERQRWQRIWCLLTGRKHDVVH